MLAHKAVPHECCHLLFTTMCSTVPTSPALTPVSPYGAAGEQKLPQVDPQGTTGGPLTGIYPNTFSNGGTERQGLVLERVQPESTSAERIVGEVDYLDVTIQRDAHGWHCDLYDKRDAMPSQSGGSRVPNIHTALSEACKYGIVHSQMHRFSRRLGKLT